MLPQDLERVADELAENGTPQQEALQHDLQEQEEKEKKLRAEHAKKIQTELEQVKKVNIQLTQESTKKDDRIRALEMMLIKQEKARSQKNTRIADEQSTNSVVTLEKAVIQPE